MSCSAGNESINKLFISLEAKQNYMKDSHSLITSRTVNCGLSMSMDILFNFILEITLLPELAAIILFLKNVNGFYITNSLMN